MSKTGCFHDSILEIRKCLETVTHQSEHATGSSEFGRKTSNNNITMITTPTASTSGNHHHHHGTGIVTAVTACSRLKQAIIANSYDQVEEVVSRDDFGKHLINKLLRFERPQCTLYLPALSVAVFLRNCPTVLCLLKNGANPNRLGKLCLKGEQTREGFATFVRASDYSTLTQERKVSAFWLALEDRPDHGIPFNSDVAEALLQAGADINTTAGSWVREEEEEEGSIVYEALNTPLHTCTSPAYHRSVAVFNFLLQHSASLLRVNADNKTPLQNALRELASHEEVDPDLFYMAEELIRRGGFRMESGSDYEMTALLRFKDDKGAAVLVTMLLEADFPCSKEVCRKIVQNYSERMDSGVTLWLLGNGVLSLKRQCRSVIRRCVRSGHALVDLSTLPLPSSLLKYVQLKSAHTL